MPRGYLVVEGQGEVSAALNLVTRLWRDLQLEPIPWSHPIRGIGLAREQGVHRACSLVRSKGDAALMLLVRDEDDGCPKVTGPETSQWIANLGLGFPAAVVLAYREYEAWFLPCLALMAGRPLVDERGVERDGLLPTARFDGNPEEPRDVKGILSEHFAPGRTYKPTLDQLPLTRMIDFPTLRESGAQSFGTLERALRFLAGNIGQSRVYPAPPAL